MGVNVAGLIFWRHEECLQVDPDSDYKGCLCDGYCGCHKLPKNMKLIAIDDGDHYGIYYKAVKKTRRKSKE